MLRAPPPQARVPAPMSLGRLPVERAEPRATFDLMAGGKAAFARILQRIDEAERSILVRCFEWRDDETGEMVARALLRAADRGVEIQILKDRVGMAYEHLEGTKQSFFHKRIGLIPRLQTWSLMTVYGRWGSLRQKPSPARGRAAESPDGDGEPPREALRPRQAVRVRRRDRDPGRHGDRRRLPPPQRRLHGRDLGRPGRRPAGRSLRRARGVRPGADVRLPAAFVQGRRDEQRADASRSRSSGWR